MQSLNVTADPGSASCERNEISMYRSLFCYTRRSPSRHANEKQLCGCGSLLDARSLGGAKIYFPVLFVAFALPKNLPHHRHKFASQTGEMNANL
jgi:hypothetical protein